MSSVKIPEWAHLTADALLQAVKQKDPHTFYHCARVGRAARRLGKAMGLNEFEQAVLEFSGLFHDIGKVGVPDNILLKPGRLTTNEMDVMKSHAEISVDILRPLMDTPFFRFLIPGVRFHHEKIDGTGYGMGLAGEKIPLVARVLAVVDTVDAMKNTRPYRKGLSMEIIKEELVRCSGTQFDANIVQVYLKSLSEQADIEEASGDELVIAHILKAAA